MAKEAAAIIYHRKAMIEVDKALKYFQEALNLEIKAAERVSDADPQASLSRGIYYRSAGSIALQMGRKLQAKELFLCGLDSNPPPEIEAEIRELLKECE